ncbi:MAG: SAF domain-containing protein [Bryobacteraceae bacterium]
MLYRGKQVYIQGEPLFDIEYSDQLLIRLLEVFNPEKFGRRVEQINLMDIDPDKLTPEMLDELADHLIAKALKEKGLNSPEMVAKVAKRLEAGETVTEEDLEMERPNVDDEPRCSSVSIIKVIK